METITQQTLSRFLVDRSRAEASKREREARANVALDEKREQAARLEAVHSLAWAFFTSER
eukprot:1654230-Amphidinium_carterae.1